METEKATKKQEFYSIFYRLVKAIDNHQTNTYLLLSILAMAHNDESYIEDYLYADASISEYTAKNAVALFELWKLFHEGFKEDKN
jgi:hypothetical protein